MLRLSLCVCLLLSFSRIFAQQDTKFSVGVQAGATLSRVIADNESPDFKQYSLLRPTVGMIAGYQFTDFLGIKSGISYQGMGNKVDNGNGKDIAHLNYLVIPALVQVSFGKYGIGLIAGPQLGILASAKTRTSSDDDWFNFRDKCEKTDVAGILGVMVEPKHSKIGGSLYYQRSFNKVYTASSGEDLYNSGFTLMLFYKFFPK